MGAELGPADRLSLLQHPCARGSVIRTTGVSPSVHPDLTQQQARARSHIKVDWVCCSYLEQTALPTNTSALQLRQQ